MNYSIYGGALIALLSYLFLKRFTEPSLIKLYSYDLAATSLKAVFIASSFLIGLGIVGIEAIRTFTLPSIKTEHVSEERKTSFFLSFLEKIDKIADNQKQTHVEKANRVTYLNIFLLMILVIIVISIRYMDCFSPQGFDTMSYVFSAELLLQDPLANLSKITHIIPTIITAFAYLLLNQDIIATAIVLPYIFGILSVLLVYSALRDILTENISFLAASLYALSYQFIRLSYDLFGQLLAIGILTQLFALLTKFFKNTEGTTKYKLKLVFLLVLLPLVHMPSFVLFFIFLIIITALRIMKESREKGRAFLSALLRKEAIISIVVILIVVCGYLYIKMEKILLLLKRLSLEVHPLRPIYMLTFYTKYLWPLLRESLILLILSIIGTCLIITEKEDERRNFLILEIFFYSFLITVFAIILGYEQAYRVVLYSPLPIIGAYGLTKLLEERIKALFSIKKIVAVVCILLMVGVSLSGTAIMNGYVPQFKFFDAHVYSDLWRVRELFGFNNKTIELVVHREKFRNISPYLAYAIVGENVYFGTISEFLEYFASNTREFRELKYIVVIETLINRSREENFLIKATEIKPGIYLLNLSSIINVSNLHQISTIYLNATVAELGNGVSAQIANLIFTICPLSLRIGAIKKYFPNTS